MDEVVLLHGIGKDCSIMQPLQLQFENNGFCVHNLSYASTQYSVEALADIIHKNIIQVRRSIDSQLHFVAHSLGCLILRYLLQHHKIENLGRIVMLAPPNHGSEVATFFKRWRLYKKIFGTAGQQLVTGTAGIASSLPPAHYEVGIIAGNRCVARDYLFSLLLFDGDNDGKVSVASTHLSGMSAHIVLPCSHPAMPKETAVIEHCMHFIKNGFF